MKKRIAIVVAFIGVLLLHGGLAWSATAQQQEQKNTQELEQQQLSNNQNWTQQASGVADTNLRTASSDKVQDPAPVILRIRVINTTAD